MDETIEKHLYDVLNAALVIIHIPALKVDVEQVLSLK